MAVETGTEKDTEEAVHQALSILGKECNPINSVSDVWRFMGHPNGNMSFVPQRHSDSIESYRIFGKEFLRIVTVLVLIEHETHETHESY